MGTALEVPSSVGDIPRKIWTREEARALVAIGFPNAERLELIDGELIDKMGKKRPHVIWQALLYEWLVSVFGSRRVEFESPSDVANEDNAYSEPEADLKVLSRSFVEFTGNPQPDDILLIIEISDSTIHFDRTTKARLYARAPYQEYWIVNIPEKRLIVHRDPKEGRYQSVVEYRSDELVSPLAAPSASVCLDLLN